ncbi:CBM35 domain-containing protein [Curtobacterium sp. MCPF17_052]|uniref:CBM35 domain-containing protein n=1 Tax=Curtobacterium sp. MCPF17_052 TaxID=2175655 RepID=UPI0024DF543B|nr:CBM35 domain-containing protein [Curtobacterium sp. MCPF17_052]WIB11803.1 CBM35 domain-containing protein [Curtobacterium sp. MCPF17_052]
MVGRDDFAATPFTKTVQDGWLTLDTGSMTVQYREGTGDFSQDNLRVKLTTSLGQDVTGSPWVTAETPSCAVGTLCEGEALALQGLASAKDHAGYTGSGFAAGFENVGNSMTFRTTVQQAGSYDLAMRYANNQGGDGKVETRTLSIVVDGGAPVTLRLPAGKNWDEWKQTTAALDLTAGQHTVKVVRGDADSGRVNVDSLAIVPSGAAYPAPTAANAGQDCAFGAVCEAEDAGKAGSATVATDHNGFSGDGFAAGFERAGAQLTAHVTGVPAAGDYALQVRYANGSAGTPTLTAAPRRPGRHHRRAPAHQRLGLLEHGDGPRAPGRRRQRRRDRLPDGGEQLQRELRHHRGRRHRVAGARRARPARRLPS